MNHRPQGLNFRSPNNLLTFIHIEKTAGETIKWILRSSYGVNHCDVSAGNIFRPLHPYQLQRIRQIHPSLQSLAGHPVTPYMQLETVNPRPLQYFTFLREPLKQCASYFQYLAVTLAIYPPDRFEEWIQTEWPRNMQTKRICGEASAEKAIGTIEEKDIFVGLTERFDESIFFLKQLVRPDLNPGYEPRNLAPDNHLAKDLLASQRSRSLIAEAVGEDSQLYEWVSQRLYPQYAALYQTQTHKSAPATFPYSQQGYRQSFVLANRLYRNLIFKPLERLYARR